MRKTAYIIATLIICSVLKLQYVWLGFIPALILISLFDFNHSVLWEIPLAALSFNVLEIAFSDDLKILLYTLIVCASITISFSHPKRLPVFFVAVIFSVIFENIYFTAAIWAMLWWSVRTTLCHFTIKRHNLQEQKS